MTNGTLNHQAALHNLYNRELNNHDAILDMSALSGDIFALTARNVVEIDVNCSRIGMPTFIVFVQFSNGQDSKRKNINQQSGFVVEEVLRHMSEYFGQLPKDERRKTLTANVTIDPKNIMVESRRDIYEVVSSYGTKKLDPDLVLVRVPTTQHENPQSDKNHFIRWKVLLSLAPIRDASPRCEKWHKNKPHKLCNLMHCEKRHVLNELSNRKVENTYMGPLLELTTVNYCAMLAKPEPEPDLMTWNETDQDARAVFEPVHRKLHVSDEGEVTLPGRTFNDIIYGFEKTATMARANNDHTTYVEVMTGVTQLSISTISPKREKRLDEDADRLATELLTLYRTIGTLIEEAQVLNTPGPPKASMASATRRSKLARDAEILRSAADNFDRRLTHYRQRKSELKNSNNNKL